MPDINQTDTSQSLLENPKKSKIVVKKKLGPRIIYDHYSPEGELLEQNLWTFRKWWEPRPNEFEEVNQILEEAPVEGPVGNKNSLSTDNDGKADVSKIQNELEKVAAAKANAPVPLKTLEEASNLNPQDSKTSFDPTKQSTEFAAKIPTPEINPVPESNLGQDPQLIDLEQAKGKLSEDILKLGGKNGSPAGSLLGGLSSAQKAASIGNAVGAVADVASNVLVDRSQFASDDWSNSLGRQAYDAVANSLMMFAPVGTVIGGAMKAGALINDIAGKKTQNFAADLETLDQVGSSYGGSSYDINEAQSKAGKKYGLFSSGARRRANRLINEARRQQTVMQDIAKDARDLAAASSIMTDVNSMGYEYQMNGGYDLRYLRAAKSGAKIEYFKEPFKVILSNPSDNITLSDVPTLFKKGGTIIDKIEKPYEIQLTDPNEVDNLKKGGNIKESDIKVIETNTTLKSVIPEGALHKNKHHLDQVGVDDSELTKKGIPVIDKEGNQQAEIELNEIIFTLEVTRELEERYREYYKEDIPQSKKDELALEAGKLLWKEIIYNTDDRTGLIDSLQKGGTIKNKKSLTTKPSYKEWLETYPKDWIGEYYDLEKAYEVFPYEQMERHRNAAIWTENNFIKNEDGSVNWDKMDEVYGSNPNYMDYKLDEFMPNHLQSVAQLPNGDYVFLKKGTERTNPELHFETDAYRNKQNGLYKTHDLIFNKDENRYYYIKKPNILKEKSGGTITQDDLDQLIRQALLNILKK